MDTPLSTFKPSFSWREVGLEKWLEEVFHLCYRRHWPSAPWVSHRFPAGSGIWHFSIGHSKTRRTEVMAGHREQGDEQCMKELNKEDGQCNYSSFSGVTRGLASCMSYPEGRMKDRGTRTCVWGGEISALASCMDANALIGTLWEKNVSQSPS